MLRHARFAALAFTLAAALPIAAAQASDREGRHDGEARTVATAQVDASAAIAAVRAAGYGPVSELDWEHGRWEVKTSNAEGRRVEVYVDASSGAVTMRHGR